MGRALAERYPRARAVFEDGDRILGFALSKLCFEGPIEELTRTENTQPALLVTSLAAYRVLEERGIRPSAAAGHSAGEYAAHVAAGSLPFDEGLRLIRLRGEAMAQAGSDRPGTMAAVLGLSADQIDDVLRTVGAPQDLAAANYNAPGQVVLSGTPEAVARGSEEARRAGAKKIIALQVSAAFHSPLMEGAARRLGEGIDRAPIGRAAFPVYANVTAGPVTEPDLIRRTLREQLLAPVRWEQTMRAMVEAGIRRFIEVGNGRVLRGLLRGVDKEALVFGTEDPDALEAALAGLAEAAAR
jgi:[acyl-carrier-protein] S-malonyltransferase